VNGRVVLYFLQLKRLGFIKIGRSKDVAGRVKTLQTALPDEIILLGSVPCHTGTEHIWKSKFKDLQLRGEWFTPSNDLLHSIRNAVASNSPLI
jgi:hypothetical protein